MATAIEAQLGQRYRDTISGLEGTAVASTLYLHGCERVSIEAMVEGEPREYAFDIPRLKLLPERTLASVTERVGGTRPTVPRTGLR